MKKHFPSLFLCLLLALVLAGCSSTSTSSSAAVRTTVTNVPSAASAESTRTAAATTAAATTSATASTVRTQSSGNPAATVSNTTTAVDEAYDNQGTISLVGYYPDSSDELITSAFGVGFGKPFDYSSLNTDDEDEESDDDKQLYSPLDVYDDSEMDEDVTMVSPLYKGPKAPRLLTEGVGRYWRDIYVRDSEDRQFYEIDALCFYETEHVYYYIDTAYSYEIDAEFIEIANAFEQNYQRIRDLFGEEADIDDNGHIRLLITDMEAEVIGYFFPADRYSNESLAITDPDLKSNESDMLYISHVIFDEDSGFSTEEIIGTICHEFQHMVFFDERERNGLESLTDKFIGEGLAMWTEAYCGYPGNLEGYIMDYLEEASATSVFSDEYEIYGMGGLFFLYFEQVYGLETIARLVESPETGIWMIEYVTGESFQDIFADFALTVLATVAYDTGSDYYMKALANGTDGIDLGLDLCIAIEYNNELNLDNGNFVSAIDPYSIGLFYNTGSRLPELEYYTDDIRMYYITTDWYSVD